jgi:hypothetical protein
VVSYLWFCGFAFVVLWFCICGFVVLGVELTGFSRKIGFTAK